MFYISPLKEEVVHLNPRVVIFRDLLSDKDIAKVKELATPRVSSTDVLLVDECIDVRMHCLGSCAIVFS